MKGKLSMGDFFNSTIAMAAQAASNAFIGQIFGGIGGLFGGGDFSLTSGQSSAISHAFGMGAGAAAFAKGGVLSGGNLSDYSGRVVTSPTFFAYDRHVSAFASGAVVVPSVPPDGDAPGQNHTRGSWRQNGMQ